MRRRYTTLTLLFLDIVCTVGIFNLALLVRGLAWRQGFVVEALVAPILITIFAVYLIDGYSPRTDMLSVDYASQHAIAVAGALLATLILTFVVVPSGYELQSSKLVIALSFLGLAAVSLGYRRIIYLRRLSGRERGSLLFVGDPESCRAFREECEKMVMRQPVIYLAVPSLDKPTRPSATTAIEAGGFDTVLADIESGRLAVEAIILRESAQVLASNASQRLAQLYFAGTPTYPLELFHQIYWRKIPTYRLNPTWLFQDGFKVAREPVFERLKRVSDIALSLLGLILGAPFIILGALAVWIEDRGTPFFAQSRVGRNHIPFKLLKLRSMHVRQETGDLYTQPRDPRITGVGRFLRASRIDELPQLWNVLRGDMSLIGPRAEWDRLVESYEQQIPCYHFRHLVKPGITGWAQVNFPYGANLEDTIRKLEYDLYYIRHFSFVLDATIVLKTIHIMLFGKGR